jgi:hypothetical protein
VDHFKWIPDAVRDRREAREQAGQMPHRRRQSVHQPHRRSALVWVAFVVTMTVVGGVLLLSDPTPAPRLGFAPALDLSISSRASGTIFDTSVPVADGRWLQIVIHDSGSQHGTVESESRAAQAQGLKGLGYHFLIGNGNGMGDGELHVGYRWIDQLAGAHVAGSDAAWHNTHSVGICLIGNGESRAFTPRQMERLVALVVGLQERLEIPIDRVLLHSNLAATPSPGRHFPVEQFREQLRLAGRGGNPRDQ